MLKEWGAWALELGGYYLAYGALGLGRRERADIAVTRRFVEGRVARLHGRHARVRGPGDVVWDADPGVSTKADMRRMSDEGRFAARSASAGGTSGTTGQSLRVKHDLASLVWERAHFARQLRWAGVTPLSRDVWFRGTAAADGAWTTRRARAGRRLIVNSYAVSPATAPAILTAIERHRPAAIFAYPSSLGSLLACVGAERRYTAPAPRAVITSSEELGDTLRARVERFFSAPVFDWYGSYERVAAVGTCARGRRHLIEDYSLAELVPAGRGDERGIVGTTLVNRAMPFLRYATGDAAVLSGAPCECGCAFAVVRRVVGRHDEALVLPDGTRIGRLDHLLKAARGVDLAQLWHAEGASTATLVLVGSANEDDAAEVASEWARRVGSSVSLELRWNAEVRRLQNGKVPFVVRERFG